MNALNKNDSFECGAYVVVFGVSQPVNSEKTSRIIAEIIEVGEFDLFLKCCRTDTVFKRPKGLCSVIPPCPTHALKIKTPAIGDLVLSYSAGRFKKTEKVLGILIELIDEPPYDMSARILVGDETHKVDFKTLIVMERKHASR